MNRSVETIRYTLKQFDKQHPDLAVFPEQTGVLTDEVKQKIYQQSRRGESVDALARRFCRTKTTIYRVLNEMRARRILELPLDYMHHESFDKAGIEKEILGPTAGVATAGEEGPRPQRAAAVPGHPVRSAAADARAGISPVPQVQLPEVQGDASCAKSSIRPTPAPA